MERQIPGTPDPPIPNPSQSRRPEIQQPSYPGHQSSASFNPQPQGPMAITGPSTASATATVASSGVLALLPPFPNSNYNFSFPNAGTFTYLCRIHDHMTGTIVVSAPAAPQLAQTGGGRAPGPSPVPFGLTCRTARPGYSGFEKAGVDPALIRERLEASPDCPRSLSCFEE